MKIEKSDSLIETEIIPYYKLTKQKKKELEPMIKKYLKETRTPYESDLFFIGNKSSKGQIIVAKHKGKPIGFTSFGIHNKKPFMVGTFVEKKYRGKGIANKLNRKRMYAIRMRRHDSIESGVIMTEGGKALQIKRREQWKKIKNIPQSIFEKARRRKKH